MRDTDVLRLLSAVPEAEAAAVLSPAEAYAIRRSFPAMHAEVPAEYSKWVYARYLAFEAARWGWYEHDGELALGLEGLCAKCFKHHMDELFPCPSPRYVRSVHHALPGKPYGRVRCHSKEGVLCRPCKTYSRLWYLAGCPDAEEDYSYECSFCKPLLHIRQDLHFRREEAYKRDTPRLNKTLLSYFRLFGTEVLVSKEAARSARHSAKSAKFLYAGMDRDNYHTLEVYHQERDCPRCGIACSDDFELRKCTGFKLACPVIEPFYSEAVLARAVLAGHCVACCLRSKSAEEEGGDKSGSVSSPAFTAVWHRQRFYPWSVPEPESGAVNPEVSMESLHRRVFRKSETSCPSET